jgi:serine phosphatase RsbU (regulator of sigma subunit)
VQFVFAQVSTVKRDSSIDINYQLTGFAADEEEQVANADSAIETIADAENIIDFTNPWKFKQADDSAFSKIDYNDSSWNVINDTVRDNNNYSSVTWYRMHFKADSGVLNVPLGFYLRQFGSASEVYLNGKFLKSYGKVGKNEREEVAEFSMNPKPYAIVLSDTHNVIAVRYSNFHRAGAKEKGFNIGKNFHISISHLNADISEIADPSDYFPVIFFAAIFLTLAVVHFIMYSYYRQKIANLYYSLYCFGIFFTGIFVYYLLTYTDYAVITTLSKWALVVLPLLVIPIVAMLHTIFYQRLLKIFWLLMIMYVATVVGIFFSAEKIISILTVLIFFVAIIEVLRVIIKSIRKGRDGAWIFSMIIFLAPAVGIVAGMLPDEINFAGIKLEIDGATLVTTAFVLSLPLSMTIYLARDFARMGSTLKMQIAEITELSSKTIEQEKEKKQILENQNVQLEQMVNERTREVLLQKEVIEQKNNEITESLLYAKRIQSAILPDMKLIYKTLEQSFILYLPKDIVSGDFYSFSQKDNIVIIAAADCTGHGVAGAFMSMIGTSLLNQIINEKGITEPSQILGQLNQGIVNALKQRDSESNDGMDISLCTIDLDKNKLKFSGANRPLWLLRNNEMLVYKPNKFPIGGLQVYHTEAFTQHEIDLIKGDAIYIFSDGFSDQFGGGKGKKLMTKKFKDELMQIQHLNMKEQENYLLGLFNKWKGNLEQVDDVLIIGIRII